MELEKARQLIVVPTVYTYQQLKRKYRSLAARKFMEDNREEKLSELAEAFSTMEEYSYELKKTLPDLRTHDGVPLLELGKGYPVHDNARTCGSCSGNGWKEHVVKKEEKQECPSCKGEGLFFVPCKKCGATGEHRHPVTGKVFKPCPTCQGTKKFYPPYRAPKDTSIQSAHGFLNATLKKVVKFPDGYEMRVNLCRVCLGEGAVTKQVKDLEQSKFVVCDDCHGVGEFKIKAWNPVISISALSF